ncbi:ABC transporter [Bacillus sp. FJAT-27231]|uniref:ABC transporter ATP-binding protein n=1 Tax=Bacillus sp. FJAT-27231 TaxID=1679168 RepID=UPI0006714E5B|nr:ABC transporter ATP-binding protein [Bacillus sp. FJAT-27231]KMY54062.1 ABC transporter [Bacillus sp. FJAT-27231]
MRKLAKHLKPFIGGIVLAIVLLFVQAISDLNLPNYMSEIINVGIQQEGIEHAAPDAMSQDGMKLITTFMTEQEKQIIEENYLLVSPSDQNAKGKTYREIYSKVNQPLYVKKELDKTEAENVDTAFGTASSTFINVLRELSPPSDEKTTESSSASININKIYRMQAALDTLPNETIQSAHDEAVQNDVMQKQSGIMLSRSFYNELGVDLVAKQTGYIIKIGAYMLVIALVGGGATVLVGLLSSRIATGVARNLRKQVFTKVESFSKKELDTFSTASLITRCTNDVQQVQQLIMMGVRMICYAPILGIGGIIMAVNKSAHMSWIIALAVVVLLGLILIVMTIALPKFKLIQKLIDKLNLISRENLSGLMVVRSFGTQEYEKARFDDVNSDLTKMNLFVNRVMVFMMPMMMLIMNGVTLLIVWVGAHQIAVSSMQVGDMMAFMQYVMQILMSFMMLSMMFIMIPRAAVSASRIAEVLETEVSITDAEQPQSFNEKSKGVLEFKNVSFRYDGANEDALHEISFKADPGQTTAIIGPTGSGKTTIASLALRFYDVSEGEILVDGVNIRDVKQAELRSKIGYVPQKGVLLSGTIESNLKYGKKDATDEEMKEIAEVAQAKDFILEKPEQFEANISQGGANVSGGQKQRLTIARALMKKPEILIFDESFSALDFKTDALLRKALKEHTSNATVVLVAQRVSTIMTAEQILVVDKGRIVGCGTHRELLESCPEYYEIASSQLSKEELA